MCNDPAQVIRCGVDVQGSDRLFAARNLGNPFRKPGQRPNKINQTGRNRILRHRAELCIRGFLRENHATTFVDRPDTIGTVRARTAQDNGHAVAARLCHRPEEPVDRRPLATWLVKWPCRDLITIDDKLTVRRYHIHAIRLQICRVRDFQNVHLCARSKDLCQHAGMLGRQMQDDDIPDAKIVRQQSEQCPQRCDATGRRPDSTDRNKHVRRRLWVCFHRSRSTLL